MLVCAVCVRNWEKFPHLSLLGSSSLYFLVAVQWPYSVPLQLVCLSFLGFVVDMILEVVVVGEPICG